MGMMAAAAYGVYVKLNAPPREEVASDDAPAWQEPAIQMGDAATISPGDAAASGGEAPSYGAPQVNVPVPPADVASPAPNYPSYSQPTEMPPADVVVPGTTPDATAGYPPVQQSLPVPGLAPESAEPAEPSCAAALEAIQVLLDQGQLSDAQLELSQLFDHPDLTPSQQQEVVDLLDQLTGTVVYSPEHMLEPPHVVQNGESLETIAQTYQVPSQLLAKINGIADPNALRPGDQLKVVRGPFSALVELPKYRLTLWLGGRYAGRFPIGIGRDVNAPDGEFTVREKQENPTYFGPDRVIPPDDPSNPLGERWVDLGNRLGIHSTNDMASIGRHESRGCIGLAPQDAEDVYDMLVVGSRVYIRR
jgi:lipoprotein-anchoring transpeptidase ErfK/SrfK